MRLLQRSHRLPQLIIRQPIRLSPHHQKGVTTPGKDCFIGGEPGWIITCDRCFKTTAYRSSEVRPLQFSWGPA
jgi:hypothetical protein